MYNEQTATANERISVDFKEKSWKEKICIYLRISVLIFRKFPVSVSLVYLGTHRNRVAASGYIRVCVCVCVRQEHWRRW